MDGCAGAGIFLFCQIPQAGGFQLRPGQLPRPAQSRVSCSLDSSEDGDDAEVVDEVVHPLTLLTACSSSGNVTEGVDEMVEAWPPWLLQKVGKKTLSFSWDSPICSGSD